MVQEAERYKAEDEAAVSRISAKNTLESYSYNLRNALADDMLATKFEPADKSKLESAVNETISWLDGSQEASKEEYESRQKELVVRKVLRFKRLINCVRMEILATGWWTRRSC
jgi:heat shock protein 1/8